MVLSGLVVAFTAGCLVLAIMTELVLKRTGRGRRRPRVLRLISWGVSVILAILAVFGIIKRGGTSLMSAKVGAGQFIPSQILYPPTFRVANPADMVRITAYGHGLGVVRVSMPTTTTRVYDAMLPVALLLVACVAGLLPRLSGRWAQLAAEIRRPMPYGDPEMRPWRWAWLMLPAAALIAGLFATSWSSAGAVFAGVVMLVLASVMAIRWPAITADLAVAGIFAVGLTYLAQALLWPSHILTSAALNGAGFVVLGPQNAAVYTGVEGVLLMALGAWLVPRTVGAHVRSRLHPDPALTQRVRRLTETRAVAVSSAAAELRRVERDLHDGTQARLVALGMNLRAVERMLPDSPHAALALVAEARESSAKALTDLRDVVRGICPPILADRGLGDAVRSLAMDTRLATEVEVEMVGRLDASVETACYFAVAEALTNVAKHSGAHSVQIRLRHADGMLRMEVIDDGCGGADTAAGTGLAGVEERLASFDGILAISSPPGGPTMIVMEVPCELSSQRISFS